MRHTHLPAYPNLYFHQHRKLLIIKRCYKYTCNALLLEKAHKNGEAMLATPGIPQIPGNRLYDPVVFSR